MTISSDDVRAIAHLARLDLSDAEVERFQAELSTILDYVARLAELDAGRAAEPADPDQPLRGDDPEPWPDVAPLHAEAPDCAQGAYHDYWFAVVGADEATLSEEAVTDPLAQEGGDLLGRERFLGPGENS